MTTACTMVNGGQIYRNEHHCALLLLGYKHHCPGVQAAHHSIPSYADAIPTDSQMTHLLALQGCGSIAAQVLQQLPAGDAIAVQEAVAWAAVLL